MRYIFLIVVLLGAKAALAQENWEDPKTGELEDSQIIIEKDRQIELPRAARNFKQVPRIKRDSVNIPVKFNIREFQPALTSIKPRIRVLTVQDEKLPKLYANQVRAGVGLYGATYLEAFLANKRSKNYSYGLHAGHKSFAKGAVDGNNSASGHQVIRPYGKYISDQFTIEGEAFYERHNNYLYGYDSTLTEVDRDTLQRTFHTIGTHLQLKDRNAGDVYQYAAEIEAYRLSTNYNAAEASVDYDLKNTADLSDNFKAYFNSNGFFSKYQYNDNEYSRGRTLFRVQPGVRYEADKLVLKGGLNFVYENDLLEDMDQLHVYPDLSAEYQLLPGIAAKAGVKGDVRGVRLKDLLLENPYLNNSVDLNHTLMPFQLYGSVYGSLFNKLGFDAGFSVASVKNIYGFQVNPLRTERFDVVYFGGNNTEVNIHTGVSAQLMPNWTANLRADYLYYDLAEGNERPYVPQLQFQFTTEYVIASKFTIGLNGHLQSSMDPGLPLTEFDHLADRIPVQIPAIYDLGIKLNYKLSERSAVFLQANNLIAKEYEYYFNYPNRGFRLLAGFIYSF